MESKLATYESVQNSQILEPKTWNQDTDMEGCFLVEISSRYLSVTREDAKQRTYIERLQCANLIGQACLLKVLRVEHK